MGHHGQGKGRQQQGGIEDDVLAAQVEQAAGQGPCHQGGQGVEQEEKAGRAGQAAFRRVGGHEGLDAAVAQAGDERHQRKAHHARVDVAVELQEGAVAVMHLRQVVQAEKDADAGQADAQAGLRQGGIAEIVGDEDAQKGAQGQGKGRAHAEQADAQPVMLVGHHIGHDGAGGRAHDAHAQAHAQALHEEQGQAGDPEEGRDAGRIEQQAGEEDDAETEQGEQVAGEETADQAADDHDARGEPGAAEAGAVCGLRIGRAGDEHQVIGRHDQQVDAGDHIEIAVEDGAQGFGGAGGAALPRPRTGSVLAGHRTSWAKYRHTVACATIYVRQLSLVKRKTRPAGGRAFALARRCKADYDKTMYPTCIIFLELLWN